MREYQAVIKADIKRTKEAIQLAMKRSVCSDDTEVFSKRQASEMVGVTMESIRNWERNGLLPKSQPYQKRYYSRKIIGRMQVIRLLLDTGYSMMVIKHFFQYYDRGKTGDAKQTLICPEDCEDLWSRTDRYMEALQKTDTEARMLLELYEEMKEI